MTVVQSNTPGLIVNGYDLQDQLGVTVETEVSGWRDGLSVLNTDSQLPQKAGTIPLAMEEETEPRQIDLDLLVVAPNNTQLESRMDELKARLYAGTIEVSFGDDDTRIFYARVNGFETSPIDPAFIGRARRVSLIFHCPDPQVYEKHGQVIGFSDEAARLPIASGTVLPTFRISGSVTDPSLSLKDFRGREVETFDLSVTLSASAARIIDMEKASVTDAGGNNKISEFAGGAFFALLPKYADVNGGGMTISVSPAADCDARYRRSWI